MTDRDAQWHLDHFMQASFLKERFAKARVLEIQGGGVPLAAPLRTQYADHLVLVGDAARHVYPITGGGIHTALRGGALAGRFLAEVIEAGRPPVASTLKAYQDRWLEQMGRTMWRLYDTKTAIFRDVDLDRRDRRLYDAMAAYFQPDSEYRKI